MNAVFGVSMLILAAMADDVYETLEFGDGVCPGNHKPGDEWSIDKCELWICYEDYFEHQSCGDASFDFHTKQCSVQYDYELRFPECCYPIIACPIIDDQVSS